MNEKRRKEKRRDEKKKLKRLQKKKKVKKRKVKRIKEKRRRREGKNEEEINEEEDIEETKVGEGKVREWEIFVSALHNNNCNAFPHQPSLRIRTSIYTDKIFNDSYIYFHKHVHTMHICACTYKNTYVYSYTNILAPIHHPQTSTCTSLSKIPYQ